MAISPADKEQIVALAKDGCSRSVIADRIGHGVTRSVVCGLLFRLGIQTARFPGICKRRRAFPKLLASEARKLPVEITRILAFGVPLLELDDDGCHWPVTGEGRGM